MIRHEIEQENTTRLFSTKNSTKSLLFLGEIALTSPEVSLNGTDTPSSFKLDIHLPCVNTVGQINFRRKRKNRNVPLQFGSMNFNHVLASSFLTKAAKPLSIL
jgi:hypothetical protein